MSTLLYQTLNIKYNSFFIFLHNNLMGTMDCKKLFFVIKVWLLILD